MTGADRVIVRIEHLQLGSGDPRAIEPWLQRCAIEVFDGVRGRPMAWAVEQVIAEAFAAPVGENRP